MTINIILSFAAVGLILFCFKWRKTGTVLIGLAVILYGAIASGLVPDYLMNRLQSPYSSQLQRPLEDNTAFIIFGTGTQVVDERGQKAVEPLAFSYAPLLAAAAMNRQCVDKGFSCKFIASGADVSGTGVSEATAIAVQLEKVGIDPASILLDEKSRNSWQNSKNTAAILREIKPARVVLLQAAPMLTRDLLYLAHFGVKPEPVAAGFLTGSHTNMSSTALYFLVTDVALHEEIGLWRYTVYNFMGWNEPRQPELELATSGTPAPSVKPASAQ